MSQHVLKRKHTESSLSTRPLALTKANLRAHTRSLRIPKASMAGPPRNSLQLLDHHRIFIDRGTAQAAGVLSLCEKLRTPRTTDITPQSKAVEKLWKDTKGMQEQDAMRMLEDKLGYRGELQDGEEDIHRSWNRNFNDETLPLASVAECSVLAAGLSKLNVPSTPRPDISYGFTKNTFGDALVTLDLLPRNCLVLRSEPWLPFWLVEWKGKDGTQEEADTQARRDGAAAVNAMYNFHRSLGSKDPAPEETLAFSMTVTSDVVYIRCHWRNAEDPAGVSFEAEDICRGFIKDAKDVFRLRSVILEMLTWARHTRLPAIKAALLRGGDLVHQRAPSPTKRSPKKGSSISSSTAGTLTSSLGGTSVTDAFLLFGTRPATPPDSHGEGSRSNKRRRKKE